MGISIAFSPYELAWKHHPKKSRKGALLRYQFPDGAVGYADCFTWPEFGDEPLETQLQLLRQGKTTPLTARAQVYARVDADARKNKVNLFANLKIPASHTLVPSLNATEDLPETHLYKVKLGTKIKEETLLLKELMQSHRQAQFRLDFNGKIDRKTFELFLQEMDAYHHQIDFCEDPFPFDQEGWQEVQKAYDVALACDRGAERALGDPEVARVIIVKPAKQDEQMFVSDAQRFVITSYLDHPIGQLSAAYFAAIFAKGEPGGLISHTAYLPNPFSERLKIEDFHLIPPTQGTGFGFDDLLEKREWVDV